MNKHQKYILSDFKKNDNGISGKGKFVIKKFKSNENYLTNSKKFITFYREDERKND